MIELHQTQYPGTENKPKRAVFIGLDFGTAYTKVAIAGSSDSFAIKLRPQLPGIDAYLQPGVLTIDEDGVYQIPSGHFNGSYLDNLKLALIEEPDNSRVRINAALFLTRVLQKARKTFMEEQQGIFGNNQLIWHLNIGLPAANIDNNPLKKAFHRVAELGWMLSVLERPLAVAENSFLLGIEREKNCFSDPVVKSARERFLHPKRIGIVPEVQAMTVSYTASPSCQKCLHLLVDVGAGTLDINVFALVDLATDDRYVCHEARVLPLGSAYLAKHRLEAFQLNGLMKNSLFADNFTKLAALPTRRALAQQLEIPEDEIEFLDGPFLNKVGSNICEAVNGVRIKYGNRVFPFFQKPLPTFLGGGGVEDSAYLGRLKKASKDMNAGGRKGLDISKLPKPDRFRIPGLSSDHFHRLAVAYGLTHDVINLGDYIDLGKGAIQYEIQSPSYRDNFISKEVI